MLGSVGNEPDGIGGKLALSVAYSLASAKLAGGPAVSLMISAMDLATYTTAVRDSLVVSQRRRTTQAAARQLAYR